MATPSDEHLPAAEDSKVDHKLEDEQIEHGSPMGTHFIETKYAGESRLGTHRPVADYSIDMGRLRTAKVFWRAMLFCSFLLWSGLNDGVRLIVSSVLT